MHNGIEYGLMQAYAEGFETLKAAGPKLDLAAAELAQGVERYEGRVDENSTGRWALELALAHQVPVPVLQGALDARSRSRSQPSFGSCLLSGLRSRFGSYAETPQG